ncbi:hypothetical protein AKO1_003071 [Acrasis kona]|uniref:A kinase anchor protein 9 n=1 Tax=Acrasis kona TaxID=1008807 RepID=A0AAW2Z9C7_9EUKA
MEQEELKNKCVALQQQVDDLTLQINHQQQQQVQQQHDESMAQELNKIKLDHDKKRIEIANLTFENEQIRIKNELLSRQQLEWAQEGNTIHEKNMELNKVMVELDHVKMQLDMAIKSKNTIIENANENINSAQMQLKVTKDRLNQEKQEMMQNMDQQVEFYNQQLEQYKHRIQELEKNREKIYVESHRLEPVTKDDSIRRLRFLESKLADIESNHQLKQMELTRVIHQERFQHESNIKFHYNNLILFVYKIRTMRFKSLKFNSTILYLS